MKAAVEIKAQAAGVALDQEFSEGVSRLGQRARGSVEAVGVPLAQRTVGELEDEQAAVLALDDGVEAAQPRGDASDSTGEVTKSVDELRPS